MHGARFRDEKLCSCAGWRFNCSGAVITANTVLSLALLIVKTFFRKLKGHGCTWEKTEWIRLICFFIASLVESVALDNPKEKQCLKAVWPHPVDFCIRFRTIRDNPT